MGRPQKKVIWDEEKIEILKEYYPKREYEKLFELIGTNDLGYIRSKASDLKIKVLNYDYTEEEVQFIINNVYDMTYEEIANNLGRSVCAINAKIDRLGISKTEKWTKSELDLLRELYPIYTNKYLQEKYFKNRKIETIRGMGLKIGLRKNKEKNNKIYIKEEIIKGLYDLSEKLGRTPSIDELIPNGLPSDATYRRYFGGYRKACELAGLEICVSLFGNATKYYSKNNDLCFSKSELIITDFFIDNLIKFKKDIPYSELTTDTRCGTKRTDWVLEDGCIVEYWGYPNVESYIPGMNLKILICQENNLQMIQLKRGDLTKLRKIFVKYL